mmetsp:Transcript_17398/g.40639  ORF Transcript_17398/g.40639 Transcript_17398/m.40639 type:complete len:364 (-) Transcript_17398:258-1349(-)|eukprot:CAMPEP_0178409030 /NCGR_PEP_ID=MMETSP0689_2-20121128/20249_1 /TAXON_ID=160604 /ORGANISM="Amphidinium massartii, Strain CS-259" /LENGTH=363 /DNA_ID=CAMNT_0020030153 /DNA_START=59 /DNA_END=1150 /DNA_ORIENTATION=+
MAATTRATQELMLAEGERQALRVTLPARERVWQGADREPHQRVRTVKDMVTRKRDGDLCETTFPNFTPLLRAAQDYARLSGCRFLGRDFHAELARGCGRSSDCPSALVSEGAFVDSDGCGEHGLARAAASTKVEEFACRLSQGDSALLKEVNLAFDLIMAESIRSTMVGKCREVDMWPPTESPRSGRPGDVQPTSLSCHCDYAEEVMNPNTAFPTIAQRLYNDEQQRKSRKTSSSLKLRQAMMASFLTDFAAEVGIAAPDMPASFIDMMEQFNSKAIEWEEKQEAEERQRRSAAAALAWLPLSKRPHDALSVSTWFSWVDRLSVSSDSEASFSTFMSSNSSRSDSDLSSSEDETVTVGEILSV